MSLKCYLNLIVLSSFLSFSNLASSQEVIVLDSIDQTIEWFESENFWGENKHADQVTVPRALITGVSPNWREAANTIPVSQKKEIFYRFLLPLVLHANVMILDQRVHLEAISRHIDTGNTLTENDIDWLSQASTTLRIANSEHIRQSSNDLTEMRRILDEALHKLDIIPAGLALGQGAYESGYGTSRFAAEGNALFGQWTYGGKGLVPEQQRTKQHGDHRIAAYDWPFDSVRSYFINLMSHPAYEDFRKLRAEMRRNGEPLDSIKLAEGLSSYSERGQEYVETLQGIIRVNNLTFADSAVFRDEAMKFIVIAEDNTNIENIRNEIEEMRNNGALSDIIERMNLE